MSRVFLIACVGMLLQVAPLSAQFPSFEVGTFGGVSSYMGDLQQVRFEKDETHPAFGAFIRFYFNKLVGLKLHCYRGVVSGADSNYEGLLAYERNLSFRSDLYELGVQGELSFSTFGDRELRMAAPYGFLGVSLFHFNPKTHYQGRWVALQPLQTEGQHYSLVQWAIPMGVGFNLNIGKRCNVGFELGFRKTFTDYLDDVSSTYPDIAALQLENPLAAALSYRTPEIHPGNRENPVGQERGNPQSKDFFMFGGFTFSMVLYRWLKTRVVAHPLKLH